MFESKVCFNIELYVFKIKFCIVYDNYVLYIINEYIM